MRINYNLQYKFDQRKCDCNREPAHCHVTRNGIRVAQVWPNSVRIELDHSLVYNEVDLVINAISNHRYELENEYEYNRLNGTDY